MSKRRAHGALYRSLFDASADAIVVVDEDGRIVLANAACGAPARAPGGRAPRAAGRGPRSRALPRARAAARRLRREPAPAPDGARAAARARSRRRPGDPGRHRPDAASRSAAGAGSPRRMRDLRGRAAGPGRPARAGHRAALGRQRHRHHRPRRARSPGSTPPPARSPATPPTSSSASTPGSSSRAQHEPELLRRALADASPRGETWSGTIVNRRKDGTLYHEEQTIAPVLDDAGAVTHFIAIKQDVSARRRAEEALARAHARARGPRRRDRVAQRAAARAGDPRPAHRPLQPALPRGGDRARRGPRAAAPASRSRSPRSTSTASRRSTTATATPPATSSSGRWPGPSYPECGVGPGLPHGRRGVRRHAPGMRRWRSRTSVPKTWRSPVRRIGDRHGDRIHGPLHGLDRRRRSSGRTGEDRRGAPARRRRALRGEAPGPQPRRRGAGGPRFRLTRAAAPPVTKVTFRCSARRACRSLAAVSNRPVQWVASLPSLTPMPSPSRAGWRSGRRPVPRKARGGPGGRPSGEAGPD